MKILHRLNQFVQRRSVNLDKLDSQLNRENSLFNSEIQEDGSVSAEVLENICKSYPELNPIWLLTGKGEMLTSDYHEIGKAMENIENGEGMYQVIAGKDLEIQLLKEHIEGLTDLITLKNKLIEEFKQK